MTPPLHGAYGFRLAYQDAVRPFPDLVPLPAESPVASVSWSHACTVSDIEEISADRVVLGARGAATVRVERDPALIDFHLPYVPGPEALVHPLLTTGIAVLARWRGDVTLHAGGFETAQGAWGVLGERESGKSTLLAALASRGYPIVADDLLTVQDQRVWAGPRCIDLRPDVARHFPASRHLGIINGRPRYRLSTPPGRARLPLRGFFVLGWQPGDSIRLEPAAAGQRLRLLYDQDYISLVGWPDPQALVPLIALPAWQLTRPRDWRATDTAVDQVLAVANGHA